MTKTIDRDDMLLVHKKNIRRLKDFLDNPMAGTDKLKVQLLGWMWENRAKINTRQPDTINKDFHEEMQTFLTLIENNS